MFPSIEHGGGLRLFDIISQLAEEHEVDLFSVYDPDLDQHSLELLSTKLGQVKLVDVATMTPANIQEWLTSLERLPGHYHIIQCEYPHSVPLIESLRSFGGKIGFTFMECMTKSFLIKMRNAIHEKDFVNLGPFVKWFWKISAAEMQAMAAADFTIAVTPEDADFLERITGRRPEIIPTCLSPSEVINKVQSSKHIKPEGNTVVFLGYFGHFPNIDSGKWYLNHVHQEVKRHIPDYRFLVVGAGDTSELQKLSSHDASVEYTGRVDDIVPYIMQGKVCILPLISGAGIRGKLNQYSIAGRPSVSTTIGNLGLNYEDGKSVLIADEPRYFAAAIVKLLTDDALNQKIATQAQAYAEENFTWERHLARLVEIYCEGKGD
jgi:glycosyltransferase involved in cell wall biosynthesis